MAKKKIGPNGQRPQSKIDPRVVMQMLMKDIKNMAANSNGKLKYLESLDDTLKEIFGVKNIASKIISGKPKQIEAIKAKIDMTQLIKVICGDGSKTAVRNMTLMMYKLAYDTSMTSKETKKTMKTIKEAAKTIRANYKISKYKSEEDVSIDDLKRFINDYGDEYEYYFGMDDDYDNTFDVLSSRGSMSNLERYLSQFEEPRRSHGYFDDDDDEEDNYIPSGYLNDDDDEDEDDENYLADIIDKTMSSAMNKFAEKIENRFEKIESKISKSVSPLAESYIPPVRETVAPSSDANMNSLIASMNNINKVLIKNNQAIGVMNDNIHGIAETVTVINEDLDHLHNRVDTLSEVSEQIIRDFYEEVDDDGVDDEIIIDGEDDVVEGAVSPDEILNAFADQAPVSNESKYSSASNPNQPPPVSITSRESPISVKDLKT